MIDQHCALLSSLAELVNVHEWWINPGEQPKIPSLTTSPLKHLVNLLDKL